MRQTLVIGIGNTLRGDDGAGIRAAELIAALHPGVECVCTHELLPELSQTISGYDDVFFLDASSSSGCLLCRPLIPEAATEPTGSHTLTPATLLHYCTQLYHRLPVRSTLIEIPAFQFDFCETLSEATSRMVHECVEAVACLLRQGSIDPAGAHPA